MQCLDCGRDFEQADLLAVSCQGCGEALMPDDIANLESKLGIVHKIPEIAIPVTLPEDGIKIPDAMECANPDCELPLYGSEIKAYVNGGPCQYCGQSDLNVAATSEVIHSPEPVDLSAQIANEEVPEAVKVLHSGNSIRTRICTGPLAGTEFDLPTDVIIGRDLFNALIQSESVTSVTDENWYTKSISRISREHFKLAPDGTVTDMGSANSTYLEREEVFGEGGKFELGKVLNLADQIMLTRVHSNGDVRSIRIIQPDTQIAIDVPEGMKFHLGRLREDERREPFAFAISDHLERTDGMDAGEFLRISRRHVTVELLGQEAVIENIDGKLVTIDSKDFNLDGNVSKTSMLPPFDFVIGKTKFEVHLV